MATPRSGDKPESFNAKKRGPGGRWICRCGCDREVQKPRRTWFSDECVHLYRISTDPGYARLKVWERDQGLCALCGVRCRYHRDGRSDDPPWEMDHRIPLSEGGVNAMWNLRTLCTPCHKGETALLAARTAQRRRDAKE